MFKLCCLPPIKMKFMQYNVKNKYLNCNLNKRTVRTTDNRKVAL